MLADLETFMALLGLSSLYVTLFDHPIESFLVDLTNHDLPVGEVVNHRSTILNSTNIAALKKVTDAKFIVHSALDSEFQICNPDSDSRQTVMRKLKESIDDAADIGAVAFVQHPGLKIFDIENGWELNCESLLSLIDYGNSRGVKVFVENMANDKHYMSSPSEFIEFIESNHLILSIAFDTGHAHIAGYMDEFIQKLASNFFLVHITDNNGISDAHLNVGDGNIDWKKLVIDLIEQKFQGVHIVEAVKQPVKSIDALRVLYSDVY